MDSIDAAAIRERGLVLGADFIGIADADGFLDPAYSGNRPRDIMPDVRAVIVLGVRIPRGCVLPLPQGRAEYTNTLMAGTATLRVIAFRLARDLEDCGHLSSIVPNEGSEFGMWYVDREKLKGDISIKYAAYLAGLGRYGLNQLLINPRFGPRVRMTAILTNAPLLPDQPLPGHFLHDACHECRECVRACPVHAIRADGTIDTHACREYMFTHLGGLRCGLCIRHCPLSTEIGHLPPP